MRYIALWVFVIVLTMAACHSAPKTRVFLDNKMHHKFSDKNHEDLFRLTITGDSLTTSLAKFEIVDYNNRQIWVDTFRTYDFYEDGDTSLKQREDIIMKKANAYFSAENFISPATDTAIVKEELNDIKEPGVWQELKNNKASIGFRCSEGYEGIIAIAYSRRKGKVVRYFSCD